ncbi:MAG: hypothetical protein MJ231_03280 [bacterium]|nr:hypothetical protein [bacterium]
MKVNSFYNNTSFKGVYSNKGVKKLLEFVADNGYLFAGTTAFVLGSTVRPLSILATPKTDKENKKYAISKALSSSTINYLVTLAISLPFAKSVKKIDANPSKYLKETTIASLKEENKALTDSKAYNLATELFKLGLGILVACPKAILTALGVPFVMNNIVNKKEKNNSNINFKGKNDGLAGKIGKLIDKKFIQDFANKNKETNFPLHMMALTDAITTTTFIATTKSSKKIKEERKNPLIFNAGISTALSILSAYTINKLTDKHTQNFIKKYSEINKNDHNLQKQINGIKILKPTLILAGVYYIIIPIISTFFAERLSQTTDLTDEIILQK